MQCNAIRCHAVDEKDTYLVPASVVDERMMS